MAVRKHPSSTSNPPVSYTGLTTDTTNFLATHVTEPNGSTYRELDGDKRIYEFQDGTWYEL